MISYRKINNIILVLFVFILFNSCDFNSDESNNLLYINDIKSFEENIKNTNKNISLSIESNMVIKEDIDHFYLGLLTGITTDKEENIYLFDDQQSKIFVLNEKGKYLRQLLGPGRGPGEILNFSSQTINQENNQIIIADGQNFKILVTDLFGQVIDVMNYSPSEVETPTNIIHIGNDKYIFLFSLGISQSLRYEVGIDDFFHIYELSYDDNGSRRIESFGNRKELIEILDYPEGSVSSIFTQANIGRIVYHETDYIIYAPYVYSNLLLKFSKAVDEGWVFDSVVTTNIDLNRPAYIDLDTENDVSKNGKNVFRSKGNIGESLGYINRRSAGLFSVNNNNLVNFFIEEFEYEDTFIHVLYGEIFDEELNHIGSGRLYQAEPGEIMWDVNWKDKNDNFYLIISGEDHYGVRFTLDASQ